MGVKAEQKGGRVVKSGANRYRYDACGRLAEKIVDRHGFRPQRWQYRWNSDNRLADLYTPNNEHWRYNYDAFGRRTRKFNFNRSNKRGTHYAHSENPSSAKSTYGAANNRAKPRPSTPTAPSSLNRSTTRTPPSSVTPLPPASPHLKSS
ncbi:RHS repeat domain-containing protein [Pseudomonas sp. LPH60]|uniref:RHS repeat domain-containing protein n=1 Tax=Pseudomonas sp. LPH60 TaxID=3065906 RepID=UPI00273CA08C|nr:RHS repeat domain-containing protein [Pseudomonas sp. LPH60]MDP4573069.1 RHS repeat domain-containing protein [Pseudomonas sp. LPH60]